MNDLQKQIEFLIEIDKLKNIYRQSIVTGESRNENDAEHSWHLAMMALVLSKHANGPNFDWVRTVKMVLIHDIVEIDAGDTFAYDEDGHKDKEEREEKAARRIFHILPEEQADEIYQLWREFEDRETPEAKFAAALDRLQPLLLNYETGGHSWEKHGITSGQVLERNRQIKEGSGSLWEYAEQLIQDSVDKGFLLP